MYGRKISDEEATMGVGKGSGSKGKRKGKSGNRKKGTLPKDTGIKADTEASTDSSDAQKQRRGTVMEEPIQADGNGDELINEEESSSLVEKEDLPTQTKSLMSSERDISLDRGVLESNELGNERISVPRDDPLRQTKVPPEVVFFGEPRSPPPPEAMNDPAFHLNLLFWARHGSVIPKNKAERAERVIPKGPNDSNAAKFRLKPDELTFDSILDSFESSMEDFDSAKSFISTNIDVVSSKLFMRALTSKKLSLQSKGMLEEMRKIKSIRDRYNLAHDQVFFPLNVEIQKSETRVMTYLAREELRNFAVIWDEVEMSLHLLTLLASRYTWDGRVEDILDDIKESVSGTVEYMADGVRNQLMTREFRKPGITAEVYRNASVAIEQRMPEAYEKIFPEIKALHETYDMSLQNKKEFIVNNLCPREGVTVKEITSRLQILSNSLAAIQGMNYVSLRMTVDELISLLSDEDAHAWYAKFLGSEGHDFETYEPDEIPALVKIEQRLRDTGNAFSDFFVQVLKGKTKYTDAFSGSRPKGETVGNWLEADPDWTTEQYDSYEERLEKFREAYMKLTTERMEAEGALGAMVGSRVLAMDENGSFE